MAVHSVWLTESWRSLARRWRSSSAARERVVSRDRLLEMALAAWSAMVARRATSSTVNSAPSSGSTTMHPSRRSATSSGNTTAPLRESVALGLEARDGPSSGSGTRVCGSVDGSWVRPGYRCPASSRTPSLSYSAM